MLNNIELIKPFIDFEENDNKFIFCQIIQRHKDVNDETKYISSHRVINTYLIRSKQHLERLMPEIDLLCKLYNARAYINLSIKSFEKLQTELLMNLAIYNNNKNICNPFKKINSLASTIKSDEPKWVIDIDTKEEDIINSVNKWLYEYFGYENHVYATIPTLNGVHLITPPFNTMEFKKNFNDIEVKNNAGGTVLYIP